MHGNFKRRNATCECTRRVPYERYWPSCTWIPLDSREGLSARCTNKDAEDPAIFRFHNAQAFARYRWQFRNAATIAELGLGSSVSQDQAECDQAGQQEQQQQENLQKDEIAEISAMKSAMKELKEQMRALKHLLQQLPAST